MQRFKDAIVLQLSPAQMSDLFFNHEKTNYDHLFHPGNKDEGPDPEEIEKALLADATEFTSMLGIVEVEPIEFVDDFLARV